MTYPRIAAAPGGRTRGEAKNQRAGGSLPSLPGVADVHTVATLHGYAVLVTVPAADEPRVRRRLYLSLHSAQKAVQRAEARGLDAQLVLVRMIPEGVSGQ